MVAHCNASCKRSESTKPSRMATKQCVVIMWPSDMRLNINCSALPTSRGSNTSRSPPGIPPEASAKVFCALRPAFHNLVLKLCFIQGKQNCHVHVAVTAALTNARGNRRGRRAGCSLRFAWCTDLSLQVALPPDRLLLGSMSALGLLLLCCCSHRHNN